MKFNELRLLSALLVCSLNSVSAVDVCLPFEPIPDFEMKQFLGPWYAIQATSTPNRCLVYDFYKQNLENIDCINCPNSTNCTDCKDCTDCKNCTNCNNCTGCTNCVDCVDCKHCTGCTDCHNCFFCTDCNDCALSNSCINCTGCFTCIRCLNNKDFLSYHLFRDNLAIYPHLIGELEADQNLPSKMSFSSILSNVAEKFSFVVFVTDYVKYAGVYSCRETPNGFEHSVTILSRSVVLDKADLDKVIEFIHLASFNPDQLSTVDHSNCNHPYEDFNVNSNDQNVIKNDEKVYVSIKYMPDKLPGQYVKITTNYVINPIPSTIP